MRVPWLGIFFWVGFFTWFSIASWARYLKERERQLTLRAFAESGKPLDPETLEKLFPKHVWPQPPPPWSPTPKSTARGLMIAGVLMLFIGIGIMIGAQLVAHIEPDALWGMSTAGVVVICVGLGLITGSIVTRRLADRDRADCNK
jgi:hypothetical protein